jgi:hypothetical protein
VHSYNIATRTLAPTSAQPKRVHVASAEGTEVTAPWDHSHDAPAVHESAARRVAELEHQGRTVTLQRISSQAMGYTFRVLVGESTT